MRLGLLTSLYVSKVLKTPVPKVLAWSSHKHETAVEWEFIIMEKVKGIQLAKVWDDMSVLDRVRLAGRLSEIQSHWGGCRFDQCGSLYLARGGDASAPASFTYPRHEHRTDARFTVGPTTGRRFNADGRVGISFDRGPCELPEPVTRLVNAGAERNSGTSAQEYQAAVGYREKACIESIKILPRTELSLNGPGMYEPTRARKLQGIDCYLKLIPYLLPTDDKLQTLCLWHQDLHEENVFVDPKFPTEVTGIIDWQNCEIAPLFKQARLPFFFHDDDQDPFVGLEKPMLPEDFSQLSMEAKTPIYVSYAQRLVQYACNISFNKRCPPIYRALVYKQTLNYCLLRKASNLLVSGEVAFLGELVTSTEGSPDTQVGVRAMNSPAYPFRWSAQEREQIIDNAQREVKAGEAMNILKNEMGDLFPGGNLVANDQYETVGKALGEVRDELIADLAKTDRDRQQWEMAWPFAMAR